MVPCNYWNHCGLRFPAKQFLCNKKDVSRETSNWNAHRNLSHIYIFGNICYFNKGAKKAAKSYPVLFHSQSKGGDAMSDYEVLSTMLMVTLIIVT